MSSLSELNKTLNQHVLEQAERSSRMEAHQEHLFKGLTSLAASVKESIESNSRLEVKFASLEAKALDRLDLVEDSVNELGASVTIQGKQIQMLELINANEQGYAKGSSTEQSKSNQKTNNTWTRTLTVISTTVAVIAVLYTIFGGVPKP